MDGPAAEWKALYETAKQDLEEERAAHAKTKAELARLQAAGAKRPAEAAASPPATKQRTSEDAPPPDQQLETGKFTPAEDARYLALLNQYGQPKKGDGKDKNPAAWAAFSEAFSYRSQPSWTARLGVFNHEEYKVWQNWTTGPKRPQNGWIGFQWRKNK